MPSVFPPLFLTLSRLDEGIDVYARPCAACVKHHPVEDAAGIGWPRERGQNATQVGDNLNSANTVTLVVRAAAANQCPQIE